MFVEPGRILTNRLKEGKGRTSGNPPTGVVFCRGEGYGRMICLIQRRHLLGRVTRVRSLRRFSPAHPVMCAVLQHVFFIMMCVTHKPLGFLKRHNILVFCVYDSTVPPALELWVLIQARRYALILSAQGHEVHLYHTPALGLWVQSYARRHALHLALILSARRYEVHLCHTPALELWVQSYARRHTLHLYHTPALDL